MTIWVKVALGVLAVAAGVCLTGLPAVPDVDSYSYLRMAEGRMQEVVKPYANRVLHPMTVRGVRESIRAGLGDGGRFLGWEYAFGIVAGVSLVVALAAVLVLNRSLTGCWTLALLASPLLCLYVVNIYLQDLFVLALTALLLVALQRERLLDSLALLFLLHLSRESTYVVTGLWVAIAVLRRQWRWAAGACLAAGCAAAVVAAVSRNALPNIHAMNGAVYMVTKIVANGLANVSGVIVWSDSYARQLPHFYPLPPLWKMSVPAWLPLGSITEIGVYRVDCGEPLGLLKYVFATFGVLPVIAIKEMKGLTLEKLRGFPMATALAWCAGLIYLLAVPFSGRTVERYIGYAWPLFWYAVPWMRAQQVGGLSGVEPFRPRFWAVHLACMWWPVLISKGELGQGIEYFLVLTGVLACYVQAWQMERSRTESTLGVC